MNQPKLKDGLYGQMIWDDEEFCWLATIENVPNENFQVYVYSDSPLNFLAVRNTHRAYQRLIGDLASIRRQAMREMIETNKNIPAKKRERKFIAEVIEKELKVFSVSIYKDLSSAIHFDAEIFEEEFIVAFIGANGEFLEARLSEDF